MHIPVLLQETLYYLHPRPNENFIDATFGEGGHSKAILEKNKPLGKVLGIEIDLNLYQKAVEKYEKEKRLILVNDSYVNIKSIVNEYNFGSVQGVLFDLGMCSWHIDASGRGFSYLKDEPLDMRFNPRQELTAFEIVNYWPFPEIEKILREYGEEKYAARITKAIIEHRKKEKIRTTGQLIELLRKILPNNYDNHRLHFAARTFQALRIATNRELDNLYQGLSQALEVLQPGGRIVVISFHSLEDRIVKNFFRESYKNHLGNILTKKPIRPSAAEVKENPRAASAKLRAFQKI